MTLRRAASLIPRRPEYPWRAVLDGLAQAGIGNTSAPVTSLGRDDLLVIWNRYGYQAQAADQHKGRVIVMENGYTPPHSGQHKFYAVGFDGLQDKSRFPVGGPERWDSFGFELKPWKKDAEGFVLVCGQRGGTYSPTSMPHEWPAKICKRLMAWQSRRILYRPHPARPSRPVNLPSEVIIADHARPLSLLLRDVAVCVVWGSNAVVEAVMEGVPGVALGPGHILDPALIPPRDRGDDLGSVFEELPSVLLPARLPTFEALAWGQWMERELQSGEPFKRLIAAWESGEC